jgi:hypothetical protein
MSKYKIEPLETSKKDIPQKKASKDQILPSFPFSWVLSGRSGSGKTQLLLNVLTRQDLMGDYYHLILVFSPTAGGKGQGLDDTYDALNLPKENFLHEFDKTILESILKNRYDLITKKGVKYVSENSRVCLIFDDMIAENIMKTPEMLKMFALLRHYLCSVVIASQSFKKIPRSIRINANFVSIFPSLESEIQVMIDEICPSGINKKQFRQIIDYCTDGRYDFMGIQNHADPGKRIRKNLDEIIDLNKYKQK